MLSKYGQTCAKSMPQKFSFINRVIKIWNSLPEEIVSAGTFSRFKSLLSHADLSRFLIVVDWASRNSMICAVFHFCCFFFARRGFRLSLVIVSLFVLVILEALLKCPLTKYLEKKKKIITIIPDIQISISDQSPGGIKKTSALTLQPLTWCI